MLVINIFFFFFNVYVSLFPESGKKSGMFGSVKLPGMTELALTLRLIFIKCTDKTSKLLPPFNSYEHSYMGGSTTKN